MNPEKTHNSGVKWSWEVLRCTVWWHCSLNLFNLNGKVIETNEVAADQWILIMLYALWEKWLGSAVLFNAWMITLGLSENPAKWSHHASPQGFLHCLFSLTQTRCTQKYKDKYHRKYYRVWQAMLGKCHVENEHCETVFNHINVYSDFLTIWKKLENKRHGYLHFKDSTWE